MALREEVVRTSWRPVAGRIVLLGLLWIVLSGADPRGWGLAVLVVTTSALVSFALVPAGPRLDAIGCVRFTGSFLQLSVRGGVDVALRALRRDSGLDPGIVSFRFRLPPESGRTFFVTVVGLLPGTLGVVLREDGADIHVLDRGAPVGPQLRLLEDRIASVFNADLAPLDESGQRR
jgi:multicomponent Na+:H+ antiporter subunit E